MMTHKTNYLEQVKAALKNFSVDQANPLKEKLSNGDEFVVIRYFALPKKSSQAENIQETALDASPEREKIDPWYENATTRMTFCKPLKYFKSFSEISKCRAKNPLYCPYHGALMMKQKFLDFASSKKAKAYISSVNAQMLPSGLWKLEVCFTKNMGENEEDADALSDIDALFAESLVDQFISKMGGKQGGQVGNTEFKKTSEGEINAEAVFKEDTLEKPDEFSALLEGVDNVLYGVSEKALDLEDVFPLLDCVNHAYENKKKNPKEFYDAKVAMGKWLTKLNAKLDSNGIDSHLKTGQEISLELKSLIDHIKNKNKEISKTAKKFDCGWLPKFFPLSKEWSIACEYVDQLQTYVSRIESIYKEILPVTPSDKKKEVEDYAQQIGEEALAYVKTYSGYVNDISDAIIKECHNLEEVGDFDDWEDHLTGQIDPTLFSAYNNFTLTGHLGVKKLDGGTHKKVAPVPPATVSVPPSQEGKLKPLAHDTALFNFTDEQVMGAKVLKDVSGHSGSKTELVELNGKKYIRKQFFGSKGQNAIKNEMSADEAYRMGGIYVPDFQEFHDTNGNSLKLSQYIEGQDLGSYWSGASEAQKQAVRDDLLKGYALDALFSNWDVLGTGMSNVRVDHEGRCWRIDNGSSFALGAHGQKKNLSYAKNNISGIEFEDWEKTGGWEMRQFPDDWRTMRADDMNKGIFDKYQTSQIFLAAHNIDLDQATSKLPDKTKAALAQPIKEMKQMADRAYFHAVGGYGDYGSSEMLDASYDLSKDGYREFCPEKIENGNYGSCMTKSGSKSGYEKKPFNKLEPQKPIAPGDQTNLADIVMKAVKSVNYHNAAKDSPNQESVNAAYAVEGTLKSLASKGNQDAQHLLDKIKEMKDSQKNGWNKAISQMKTNLVVYNEEGQEAQQQYQKNLTAYQTAHKEWSEQKKQWDKKEAVAQKEYQKTHGHPKYTSLVHQMSEYCKKRGTSYAFITKAHDEQGTDSWTQEAVKEKVCEMALRGLKWDDWASEGVWDHYNSHKVQNAIKYYKNAQEDFKRDCRALAINKAGLQLLFENTKCKAYRHEDRTLFLVRTEGIHFKEESGHKEGEVCKKFSSAPCESHSMFGKASVMGHIVYACRVPISNVCGAFFMESSAGSQKFSYFGESEHEVTADKHHIKNPIVCLGDGYDKGEGAYYSMMKEYDKIVSGQSK